MRVFFIDDARQRNCARERMGDLVAVGGISIDEKSLRPLETAVNGLCAQFGFPAGEVFKWSPGKDHWMRENLQEERRVEFIQRALTLAAEHGASAQVTIADSSRSMATRKATNHEMDVLVMALERFDVSLAGSELGMVIVARPSGGRKDEDEFLADCVEVVTRGTDYTQFGKVAMNVLTMPFPNSRLLQLADLVVSITTAMVAGHERFASPVFPTLRSLYRTSLGRIGGAGVKIHPDFVYANLYHWVLGDDAFWSRGNGTSFPITNRPYSKSATGF